MAKTQIREYVESHGIKEGLECLMEEIVTGREMCNIGMKMLTYDVVREMLRNAMRSFNTLEDICNGMKGMVTEAQLSKMKKFEYYSFFGIHGDTTNEHLDKLGKAGWEAYAVVPNGDTIVVYLKREKR